MKKRILLVNPPSGFLADQKVFLPLGIANIAAVARQQEHDVSLVDLAGVDNYLDLVAKEIRARGYDAVGITSTSPQFYYAYKILERIRAIQPGLRVILGGSHASMFGAFRRNLQKRFSDLGFSGRCLEDRILDEDINFLRLEDFDIIAEGEEDSLALALESDQKWVDGGVPNDLESLPLPARDLFNMGSYLYTPTGKVKFNLDGKPTGSLISQRGCPYTCTFCCGRESEMYHGAIAKKNGPPRRSSPQRVLGELDDMNSQFGLTSFMFYDDEFNLSPQHTLDLCKALQERNYRFRGFVRTDLLIKHPELARIMAEAGFLELLIGIESGSDRLLKDHIRKGTTAEMNYHAMDLLMEQGFRVKALTMLGHPNETPGDIMATRDWLLKAGKKYMGKLGPGSFTFDLTVFQPYAGSLIWDQAERNLGRFSDQFGWVYHSKRAGKVIDPHYGGLYINKIDFSTEKGFYKGVPGEYKAFIRTDTVSAEQFVALRDAIEWEVREELGIPQVERK